MSKKQKKDKAARSTRQLMGIEEIKDYWKTHRPTLQSGTRAPFANWWRQ